MADLVRGVEGGEVGGVGAVLLAGEVGGGGDARGWHVEVAGGAKKERPVPVGLALLGEGVEGEERARVVHGGGAEGG